MVRQPSVLVEVVLQETHFHRMVVKILTNAIQIHVVKEQYVKIYQDILNASVRANLTVTHISMVAYMENHQQNAVTLIHVRKENNVFYTMVKTFVFALKVFHEVKKQEYVKMSMNALSMENLHAG